MWEDMARRSLFDSAVSLAMAVCVLRLKEFSCEIDVCKLCPASRIKLVL